MSAVGATARLEYKYHTPIHRLCFINIVSEKRKKRLLDDICRPVCMAWHINEEWEEVPFKVGPGEITILIIE